MRFDRVKEKQSIIYIFFYFNEVDIIHLFLAYLVNSQNYATGCRLQHNALLPEAARRTELSTVPRGIVLTILPNRHDITVLLHNGT